MDDDAVVAAQLGRPLSSAADTALRCHLGVPVVVRVPPHLEDGTPFPTRFWLTCPLAQRRIGRLESAGGVRAMDRKISADPEFAARHRAAARRYAAERDELLGPDDGGPRPTGGVGGSRGGAKCLHAHYADFAVGNDNPVGELVAPWVEPLDCERPCIVEVGGRAVTNSAWREPS